jgi:hypothetical protein
MSATLTLSKQFILPSLFNGVWNNGGGIELTVKMYYFTKENFQNHDVKSHNFCRDLFKRLQILTFPCVYIYIYSLINFITNNKELFRQMKMYTVLTQDTNTVFINQLPTSRAYYAGIKIFYNLQCDLKYLINEKHDLK